MIRLYENRDITKLNSFGVKASARWWIDFDRADELVDYLNSSRIPESQRLFAGSGTNLLFTADFNGCIIHPTSSYIRIKKENEEKVILEAGAGLEWDNFVEWTVERNYHGLENLSLIPGTTGAAAVQNIGAYGAEIGNSILEVEVTDLGSGEIFNIPNADCQFAYRSSIFKRSEKSSWLVTGVSIQLSKKPVFNLSYGNLAVAVERKGELNQKNVRDAVIETRLGKLPDHRHIGNAGSFFKNPLISINEYNELINNFPGLPQYPAETDGMIKIPAAWLIEKAGWKGFRKGDTGVYEKQALVLVNHGEASGLEIWELAKEIRESVHTKFGLLLEPEVKVILP